MTPLPCTLVETKDEQEFVSKATALLATKIIAVQQDRGECIVGLSGGSTPGPVYQALGENTDIDWTCVKLFLLDERWVPADDKNSNQQLVRDTLLANADVPPGNMYFPDTSLSIEDGVIAYGEALVHLFSAHPPDVITLGLGPDGHIASLFPPVPETAFGEVLVLHTTTDAFAVHDRISVSPLVILASQQQVLLITGEQKRATLERAMKSDLNPAAMPLQVALSTGRVTAVIR
jgi:6-phosphogluconolactonase